jgi:DNA-binding transcriptional LysR family regulator
MDLSEILRGRRAARRYEQSYSRAEYGAVERHRTHPGLGARTQALLFHRHSRGVALTNAGFRPLPYASKSAWVLDEAKRAVLGDEAPVGRLELGSLETTASLRHSPLITRYSMAHPELDVSLRLARQTALEAA